MVPGSAVGLPLEVGNHEGHLRERDRFPRPAGGPAGAPLCAGRIRGSNVASGWGTPRRSAGIQARAPTGSHDRPVRADRSNNKSTAATAHPSQPAPDRFAADVNDRRGGSQVCRLKPVRNGGFHDASTEPVTATATTTTCEKRLLAGASPVEPTGFEPVTSCLQRSPSERAKWRDLLGIPRFLPLLASAKARFVCRDFSGRWSTEVGAWTSSAARWPRVLLGASDAPRR